MSVSPEIREIEAVVYATLSGLHEMDLKCDTGGLCNYVSCSPFTGMKRKDEAAITWGVTEILQRNWEIDQCGHDYPQGGDQCDRVLELSDGSLLWLEIKLAWRTWYYEGIVKYNSPFMYNGYLNGNHHSHSVADDFEKLKRIGSKYAKYVALLVIGFDGKDGKMSEDMATLIKREQLDRHGWSLNEKSWQTKQSDECWIRCWFAWRKLI